MDYGYFTHHRRCLFFVVALFLGLAGCAEFDYETDRAARESRLGVPASASGEYVVREGDTLYAIAWSNNLDFKELASWNNISSPDHIRVGARLRLTPPPGRAGEPSSAAATVRATPLGGQIGWQWPLQGQIVRAYNADAVGKRGILIRGEADAEVRAAAGGRVVYSGDGLRGYGNLIIVKHDDRFLTAYGYNERLLVTEGDRVDAGQPLALIGGNAQQPNSVHFEIRNLGKPVNPTDYLP